jgi:hypothetical protein
MEKKFNDRFKIEVCCNFCKKGKDILFVLIPTIGFVRLYNEYTITFFWLFFDFAIEINLK